ncbi:MAG: OmpA family protein [Halieaceae bacterium]
MKVQFRNVLAVFTATSLLLLGQAAAALEPITITLGGSENIFDDDREVDDELIGFGAVEYRFGERWAGEFWLSDGDTDGDNGFDADITRWHLDALYYLKPMDQFHPYLAFGGGQLKRDWDVPNGNLDDVDEEANAGAGVHWFMTDNFSLRADARYLFGFDDSTSDFTVSLGLSYRFGGASKKPAPAPAPAPAPEPEPEPQDSDGDGIFDDQDKCPGTPAGVEVDKDGCEIKFARGESVQLQVNFAFDSDKVDTRYLDDIEALAGFLKRHPDVVAEIEAHTDSMGPESYNLGLSQRRADSVIRILEQNYAIPADRLVARGFGESQPIADNGTEDGRAANRRVMATLAVD